MTSPSWRVIPSVRDLRTLDAALSSPSPDVLLSNVHIGNLVSLSSRVHAMRKNVFVQSDLIGGFRADPDGILLLRNNFKVDGVFTSSHQTLALAKRTGMRRYYRVALMDSRSVTTALQALKGFQGDGVELLPAAVALDVHAQFRDVLHDSEILAGGFIRTDEMLSALRDAGLNGATTSNISLWSEHHEISTRN